MKLILEKTIKLKNAIAHINADIGSADCGTFKVIRGDNNNGYIPHIGLNDLTKTNEPLIQPLGNGLVVLNGIFNLEQSVDLNPGSPIITDHRYPFYYVCDKYTFVASNESELNDDLIDVLFENSNITDISTYCVMRNNTVLMLSIVKCGVLIKTQCAIDKIQQFEISYLKSHNTTITYEQLCEQIPTFKRDVCLNKIQIRKVDDKSPMFLADYQQLFRSDIYTITTSLVSTTHT